MEGSMIMLLALLISVIVVAHLGYILFLTVGGAVYAVREKRRERAGRASTREAPREIVPVVRKRRVSA